MKVFGIVLAAAAAYILVFHIFPAILGYFLLFGKRKPKEADERHLEKTYMAPHYGRILDGMGFFGSLDAEEAEVMSEDGLRLRGKYYDRKADRTVIFVHGYNATPMYNFAVFGKDLYERGFNVLMPIQRAHTGSEGKHSTLGLKERSDVLKWTEWCINEKKCGKIILAGTSMGGTAIAYASDRFRTPQVRAMVIDCAFTSPYAEFKKLCIQYHVPWIFMMPVLYAGMKLLQKTDIKESTIDSLKRTEIPAFFMCGTKDRTVLPDHVRMNFEACASEKQFVTVEGADHSEAYPAMDEDQRKRLFDFIDGHTKD